MKKFVLLTVLLLASYRSISQSATPTSPQVVLDETIARDVVKDLISYDACRLENTQLRATLRLTERKADMQGKVIINLQAQQTEQESILQIKDQQIASQEKIIADTEILARRRKTESFLWKLAAIAGAGLSVYVAVR